MRSALLILLVSCSLCSSSASAIDCQSAPGAAAKGWWSWREIEGRKCWFLKAGAMPAKSELRWSAKATLEEPPVSPFTPVGRAEQTSILPPEDDSKHPVAADAPAQVNETRVKPAPAAPVRVLNGQVDLLNSAPLATMQAIGARRKSQKADP